MNAETLVDTSRKERGSVRMTLLCAAWCFWASALFRWTMGVQPTKPTKGANMETRSFLMLVSMSKETAAAGKALMDRVKAQIDPAASPQWIDSRGIGVFFKTDLPSWKIWSQAFPDSLSREDQMALKDILIVQVGPEWEAPRESKAGAWLNGRFPKR